ncbi:hypothetical protein XFF6990_130016 [Xanthomonas citri pv. fuscans]|uniref:Uncharacterized protein n=1 Tax=Xanthomonas campestris pv. phaseoli TaxID=317013 RepID=A0A7Z7NHP6_XANCH|nr:hypothetical protein XFF6990_130016 [Xanthomonas citri pv. fuscans]SOO24406.1 hypothetical protein XFF6991_360019 [Xanthomonas phaseoli pv. phaseoli]
MQGARGAMRGFWHAITHGLGSLPSRREIAAQQSYPSCLQTPAPWSATAEFSSGLMTRLICKPTVRPLDR